MWGNMLGCCDLGNILGSYVKWNVRTMHHHDVYSGFRVGCVGGVCGLWNIVERESYFNWNVCTMHSHDVYSGFHVGGVLFVESLEERVKPKCLYNA